MKNIIIIILTIIPFLIIIGCSTGENSYSDGNTKQYYARVNIVNNCPQDIDFINNKYKYDVYYKGYKYDPFSDDTDTEGSAVIDVIYPISSPLAPGGATDTIQIVWSGAYSSLDIKFSCGDYKATQISTEFFTIDEGNEKTVIITYNTKGDNTIDITHD